MAVDLKSSEAPGVLRAVRVCKSYDLGGRRLEVLRELSLGVSADAAVAIMGPSGSGKSTLLSVLGALEPPSGGVVTLEGVNPYELPESELAAFRNRRVGFVFQNHHLLPQCSALENVLIPTLPREYTDEHVERARRLLERVGLGGRLDHRPAELSGGESQRVAVARALINRPALLLADEPTGNLDHSTAEAVVDLLMEVHRQEQTALILVTHSAELARRLDRVYHLVDGTLAT